MRLGRRAQPQGRDVLLDHVLLTIDGERQEIAGRLHDGPQQLMTAIRLLADGAHHALETGQTEQAGRTLERLQQLAMEAADDLRRLAGSLHPVALEQSGLVQALAALTETLQDEHGVAAQLTAPAERSSRDNAHDAAVYMIARETAVSAVRAGATSVAIELTQGHRSLRLRIETRGGGDPDPAVALLLHERAVRIGGALEVSGQDPQVVTLTAPVPIETGSLVSYLDHTTGDTRQSILSLPEPLDEDRTAALLPRLSGCEWVVLGGQTGGDFPPESIALLAGAGHKICLDAQGLARGSRIGPVHLGPIDLGWVEGVTALKLNDAEAGAAGPLTVPELLVTMAQRGCTVTAGGAEHRLAGSGLRFADPTGAGDSFCALYCLARSGGSSPPEAAAWAQQRVEQLYAG